MMSSVAAAVTVSSNRSKALERARRRMGKFFQENQVLGRRNAIGCVALEITQRCNLDCTLCYLSENSERVKDIPIQEVFRRIDRIYQDFGAPTSVQITGGTRRSESGRSWSRSCAGRENGGCFRRS